MSTREQYSGLDDSEDKQPPLIPIEMQMQTFVEIASQNNPDLNDYQLYDLVSRVVAGATFASTRAEVLEMQGNNPKSIALLAQAQAVLEDLGIEQEIEKEETIEVIFSDTSKYVVIDNLPFKLSLTESELLKVLYEAEGNLTKLEIAEKMNLQYSSNAENTVEQYVKRLRDKLKSAPHIQARVVTIPRAKSVYFNKDKNAKPEQVVNYGPIQIDLVSRDVLNTGNHLTPTELKLLQLFYNNRNKVVDLHMLADTLVHGDIEKKTLIEEWISNLRKKIDSPGSSTRHIESLRSGKYIFRA